MAQKGIISSRGSHLVDMYSLPVARRSHLIVIQGGPFLVIINSANGKLCAGSGNPNQAKCWVGFHCNCQRHLFHSWWASQLFHHNAAKIYERNKQGCITQKAKLFVFPVRVFFHPKCLIMFEFYCTVMFGIFKSKCVPYQDSLSATETRLLWPSSRMNLTRRRGSGLSVSVRGLILCELFDAENRTIIH